MPVLAVRFYCYIDVPDHHPRQLFWKKKPSDEHGALIVVVAGDAKWLLHVSWTTPPWPLLSILGVVVRFVAAAPATERSVKEMDDSGGTVCCCCGQNRSSERRLSHTLLINIQRALNWLWSNEYQVGISECHCSFLSSPRSTKPTWMDIYLHADNENRNKRHVCTLSSSTLQTWNNTYLENIESLAPPHSVTNI